MVKLGDGQTAIVTDTVGFIHKLPHQLVDAFRATLEEVNRADVLIEVVDASDPHLREHRATVQIVLDELGAGDKPRLVTFNKADLVEAAARDGATPAPALAGSVLVSALTGYGLDTLRAEIAALLASLWVDVVGRGGPPRTALARARPDVRSPRPAPFPPARDRSGRPLRTSRAVNVGGSPDPPPGGGRDDSRQRGRRPWRSPFTRRDRGRARPRPGLAARRRRARGR